MRGKIFSMSIKNTTEFKRIPHVHKHIYKLNGRFRVEKSINGKHKVFKTFSNVDDAIKYRDKLIDNNWEPLPLTSEEVYEKNYKEYYQGLCRTSNGRRYQITNSKGEYLATIASIEEALYYRDQYYTSNKTDAPRPSTLDLKTNNWYINEGLEYPIPERLIQFKNNTYGEGAIQKVGNASYKVIHGGKNGEYSRHVCSCRTYEQAYYVKQEMNKCNWDRKQLKRILHNYPLWYSKLMELYRYIHLDHNHKRKTGEEKYKINLPRQYLEEGQNLVTIPGYSHVEDALYERDFLVEHDWDYDLLVECIDDNDNPYYSMDLPPYPERKILNLQERNYHEKELTMLHELINMDPDLTQEELCEIIGVSEVTLRNWFKFWNTNMTEFRHISLSGENPINVLEKVPQIYTPDLSRPKPPNFKGYIHHTKRDKRSPYKVIKDNIRYGSYYTEKQAKKAVKLLQQCDWDKSKLSEIQKKVGWEPLPERGNIYPYTTGKGWTIRHKDKNRKMISYGSYKDHDLAVIVRDMLILNNWNKDEYPQIRNLAEDVLNIQRLLDNNMFSGEYDYTLLEQLCHLELIQDSNNKYIRSYGNKFTIQKYMDGDIKNFGVYDTKKEAIEMRDLLIENNWDSTVLELIEEMNL